MTSLKGDALFNRRRQGLRRLRFGGRRYGRSAGTALRVLLPSIGLDQDRFEGCCRGQTQRGWPRHLGALHRSSSSSCCCSSTGSAGAAPSLSFKTEFKDPLNGRFDVTDLSLDIYDSTCQAVFGIVRVFPFRSLLPQDLIQSKKKTHLRY